MPPLAWMNAAANRKPTRDPRLIEGVLVNLPLMEGVARQVVRQLSTQSVLMHFKRGETVIRRGERVDVQQCRGSWCYVEKRGPDGWVSANYLERGGRPGWNNDDHYRPPVYRPYPPRPRWDDWPSRPRYPYYGHNPYNSGSRVCVNGPNGYFCVGD